MGKKVVCFGEVLWDVFPAEKVVGGAPMNVAIRLQSLGIESRIISRIGKDGLGTQLVKIIQDNNVDTSLIQIDENLGTGEVLIKLDKAGSATYEIVYPTAWDKIEICKENLNAVSNADAFVFGSLACRDEISRNTLLRLMEAAKLKVFDMNLRAPYYSIPFITGMMKKSDIIKLNDDELLLVAKDLGSHSDDIKDNIKFISSLTNAGIICVTMGSSGAILYADGKFYSHNGFKVKVEDTVGSGDSFLAAFIFKLLNIADYDDALNYACAIGAIVASKRGANPMISKEEINSFCS
jgi:fructokinase